jgi:hypothetical protein
MSMMIGPKNAKRTPIIQLDPSRETGEDIKAISLSQNNRDMEYSSWINWLLKIAAAVFQIDPAEIGFVYGTEGQSATMNERGPQERIAHSRDKGLRPFMRAIQSWINCWLIEPYDDDFKFEFVGFDVYSEQNKVEMDIKRVRSFMTINEVRAEHDLPPLDGPTGDLILDGVYTSAIAQLAFDEIGSMDPATGDIGIPQPDEVGPDQPLGGAPAGKVRTGEGTTFDDITLSIAAGIEDAIAKGKLAHPKGGFGKKGRWVLVKEENDEHSTVVEVDK